MSDDYDGYATAARAIGAVIWRAPMLHERPEILPVRWWRDHADRYRSRSEPAPPRHGFDPSDLPDEARNREWEKMAWDSIMPIVPLEFVCPEPNPIADIKMTFKLDKLIDPPPWLGIFGGWDDL